MNIFKKTFLELIGVVVLLIIIVLVGNYFIEDDGVRVIEAYLGNQEVSLEVADNSFLQKAGLSGREELPKNHGMIFVYEQEFEGLSFWMKDTLIPLDMIFLNEDFEVVHVIEDAPICEEDPCPEYTYDGKAQYVIELSAGWVEKNELEVGDSLETKAPSQSDS